MEHGSPDRTESDRAWAFMRWAYLNVFLALSAALVTIWIHGEENRVHELTARLRERRAEECRPRVFDATPAPAAEPVAEPPPEDAVTSGYLGATGKSIKAAVNLQLEAIRGDDMALGRIEQLRLGSQDVLPSGTIHVMNLWATWCGPCRDEMPDFQTLFARREDWGKAVRFVPVLLKDLTDPLQAYQLFGPTMPEAPVKLADRGYKEPLATALMAGEKQELFKGGLPVTLLLDCNRRVRWAQFTQLSRMDFEDLERRIDELRAELAEPWCTRPWCGNGRCEGTESTPANHCPEDCGELKKQVEGVSDAAPPELLPPVVSSPTPAPVVCPPDARLMPNGTCKRKLQGTAAKPPPPPFQTSRTSRCGNGACEAALGETSTTCCRDCACTPPLVCRSASSGEMLCLVRKLK